jgi:hypothetical protein
MDCRLKCEKPEDILYTLTITMKAGEWERIRDQMGDKAWQWPMCDLRSQITDLLSQARKIYWPQNAADEPLR